MSSLIIINISSCMILLMFRMDSAPATNRRISRVIEVNREESFRFVGNIFFPKIFILSEFTLS